MSHPSTLDLDRYSSLGSKARRSTGRRESRSLSKAVDVLCDFCSTRKEKAVMSCLLCLASYCENHLQSHYEYPALMKHKLVKATGQMREKICAQHDKLLEAFCRTDQTSVCVLCMMDEHKHHDTVPAGTERTEKQVRKRLDSNLKSNWRCCLLQGWCHFPFPFSRNSSVPLCTNLSRGLTRVKKWQDLRQAVESVKVRMT